MSGVEPSAVRDVYVFVWRGDALLLLLRDGTGYKDGEWGPPAGKVEPGESYREAGVRELREETGLHVSPSQLRFKALMDRSPEPGEGSHWVGAFFEVSDAQGDPLNLEPEKCRSMDWYPLDALPNPMVDYVRHVLTAPPEGVQYAEWPATMA